ncbi:hypothetical protein JVT61DRAFT_6480 [Boletus reticuloceps]|uniref:L domain-like protein n=1 Tax=Boletus reticuloceps TaxID=495285 RepID=A0A8I2YKG6_9AGAM|nr:hypothetical protein JVT61DRAFT_6480 [Boletus reticuloceps]
MSRVPPSSRPTVKTALVPPSSRSRSRAPSPSKPSASAVAPPLTPRIRTKSIPKSPSKPIRRAPSEAEIPIPKTPLSIKEAIALKRAEAKKTTARPVVGGSSGFDSFDTLEDAPDSSPTKKEADENAGLGRWSVKEIIERARTTGVDASSLLLLESLPDKISMTGSINLVSRSLPCLPSALFEIHLGVKPDALKSVPQEPPIGSSEAIGKRSGQRGGPAWFEAQDLQVLKAWNNEIVEIQHEISLFGSLKSVDLHQNKICALPVTFADLTALTSLDLSHNSLTSVPINIFTLPTLSILNLSHNALVALPFGEPFSGSSLRSRMDTYSSGGFFGPVITRAGNSDSSVLIRAFWGLSQLKELRLANADIGDDAFPPTLLTGDLSRSFSSLRILDLEETRASAEVVSLAFSGLKQSIVFDMTTDEPPEGTLRITVGKKVLKEAWEIEAERRVRHRSGKSLADGGPTPRTTDRASREEPTKEAWEIEVEQGLLTEGGRRRARAAAAAAATESSVATVNTPSSQDTRSLVTGIGHPSSPPPQGVSPSTFNLSNPQYYHAASQTLTLPPSAPPPRLHTRSFSLATSALNAHPTSGKTDIALPTPSLPIAVISSQSFAQTLKILILSNRKLDLPVSLPCCQPEMDAGLIPTLEELVLDGCGFGDNVAVTRQVEGSATPIKSSEPFLPLLTRLFPKLRTLDVSYNALTSAALHKDVLIGLIMASTQDTACRTGLRHLRLRGNRITTLDGFQEVTEIFKGHRSVPDWKLEELDLRDNEISKLPPKLGLLSLDVFLVDGNV